MLLTGFASIATAVEAIQMGANDYLAKPVDTKMLLKALKGKGADGGNTTLSNDIENKEFNYSISNRGVISWLNDLHKGRNTGLVWKWFINVFAVAIFIFSLTGLWLLQIHSKRRPSTWYVTASGLLIPAVLVYFI